MLANEYVSRVPHRVHNEFLRWLSDQQDEPSRADYYSMQIAATVARSVGVKCSIDDFRLGRPEDVEEELTPEETAKLHMSYFIGMCGGVVQYV